jgi:hypothetical protein
VGFQALETETIGFSRHWMARGAPQEISRIFFQGSELFSRFFPGLGRFACVFSKPWKVWPLASQALEGRKGAKTVVLL